MILGMTGPFVFFTGACGRLVFFVLIAVLSFLLVMGERNSGPQTRLPPGLVVVPLLADAESLEVPFVGVVDQPGRQRPSGVQPDEIGARRPRGDVVEIATEPPRGPMPLGNAGAGDGIDAV